MQISECNIVFTVTFIPFTKMPEAIQCPTAMTVSFYKLNLRNSEGPYQ